MIVRSVVIIISAIVVLVLWFPMLNVLDGERSVIDAAIIGASLAFISLFVASILSGVDKMSADARHEDLISHLDDRHDDLLSHVDRSAILFKCSSRNQRLPMLMYRRKSARQHFTQCNRNGV